VTTRKLILVVEDETDAAELLQYHLRRGGYATKIANDGRTALNTAIELKPDLILLDLMLPNLHGFEVARLLRSCPATQHIPIVVLTAMTSLDSKIKGFSLGVDDYVTKPFEMKELIARVKAHLFRRLKADPPNFDEN
jgi:DNA-binding response OmpR family regulator